MSRVRSEFPVDPEVRHWAQRRALGQKLHYFVLSEERRKGHEEGIEQGRKGLVIRLLRVRFGELPGWVERLLVAGCVDEVFGD